MRLFIAAVFLSVAAMGPAQQLTPDEQAIASKIGTLREVPDSERGRVTTKLALAIRNLPAGQHQVMLANSLANLSTEGDFGHSTLQEVATTLAAALRDAPQAAGDPAYSELAQLERYEHVKANLGDPKFKAAETALTAIHDDQARADFTLQDINGRSWTRSELKGKVVLVNFWATWCPPCRKEMPDLERLYQEFEGKGLVVLAISDEDASKVKPFIAAHGYTYPILLDPGRKVNERYHIQGIPNSFIYDRSGRLVGQAIDMRTREQFLRLLSSTGLK